MKAHKKKKINLVAIYFTLIMLCVIYLSIGFSAFSDRLSISDMAAVIRAQKDVRITAVLYDSSSNGGTIVDYGYSSSDVTGTITLPNSNSTVKFMVEVTNIGNVEVGFSEIGGLNSNLDYDIDGYTEGEKLCDDGDTSKCKLRSVSTFYVTLKYASGAAVTSNQINFSAGFSFKEAHDITYINIAGTSGFPSVILDGEPLNVTFQTDVPYDLKITKSDSSVLPSSSYSYTTSSVNNNYKVLNVLSVDDSLTIDRYYSITYVLNGGTNNGNNPTRYLTSDSITINNPTYNNAHVFDGWYQYSDFSGGRVTSTNQLSGEVTLYAKWLDAATPHTISYILNGGTQANGQVTSYYETVPQNILNPTKANNDFDGWYQYSDFSGSVITSTSQLTGDVTLYAKWTPVYTISYVLNGGTQASGQVTSFRAGSVYSILNPTKANNDFDGWFQYSDFSGNAITSTSQLNSNTTLYALWTPVYRITYDYGNGNQANGQIYSFRAGTTHAILDATNSHDAKFDGWYTSSGTLITSTSQLNSDTELTARWSDTISNATYNDGNYTFTTDPTVSLGSYNRLHNNAVYSETSAHCVITQIQINLGLSYSHNKAGTLTATVTNGNTTLGTGTMQISRDDTSATTTIDLSPSVQVGGAFTLQFTSFNGGNSNKLTVNSVEFIVNP